MLFKSPLVRIAPQQFLVGLLWCVLGCGNHDAATPRPQAASTHATAVTNSPAPSAVHGPHVVSVAGALHEVVDGRVSQDDAVESNAVLAPMHWLETDGAGGAVIEVADGVRVNVEPLTRFAIAPHAWPSLLVASGAAHVQTADVTANTGLHIATTRAVFRPAAHSEFFVYTTADGSVVKGAVLAGEVLVEGGAAAAECDVVSNTVRAAQVISFDAEHVGGETTTPGEAPTLTSLRAGLPHVSEVCEQTGLAAYTPGTIAPMVTAALAPAESLLVNYPDIVSQRDLLRRQGNSPRVTAQLAELHGIDTRLASCQNKVRALWERANAIRGCSSNAWGSHFASYDERVRILLAARITP